jgi:hypothetical protein
MQANARQVNGQPSSPPPPSFLDFPYELREMVYLRALAPLPTRIHPNHGTIRLWSLVPNFNPGERMTIPALFLLSKQIHDESTRIFFVNTCLVFRVQQLEQPLRNLDCIPAVAKLHVRTVDIHIGAWCWKPDTPQHLIRLIREDFPNFQNMHLTLEQRPSSMNGPRLSRTGDIFPVARQTLSTLLESPLRLTCIRIFIHDAFQGNGDSLPSFKDFLGVLSGFPQLEEVEIYFQTIVRGFIMYPTPTHAPEPAPTRATYLALEKRVLCPYLSILVDALPQVRHFQIWRLRTRGHDLKTGTQPIKERDLLDLLGGRARDIDSLAGFPVVRRFPDGSAVVDQHLPRWLYSPP